MGMFYGEQTLQQKQRCPHTPSPVTRPVLPDQGRRKNDRTFVAVLADGGDAEEIVVDDDVLQGEFSDISNKTAVLPLRGCGFAPVDFASGEVSVFCAAP